MQFINLSLLAIAVVGTVAQVSFAYTPGSMIQVGVQTEFSWDNAEGPVSFTLKFGNLTTISTLASKGFHHGDVENMLIVLQVILLIRAVLSSGLPL